MHYLRFLICLYLCCCIFQAHGQEKNSKRSISVELGPDFFQRQSRDGSGTQHRKAVAYSFEVNYSHRINENFGLAIGYGYSRFSLVNTYRQPCRRFANVFTTSSIIDDVSCSSRSRGIQMIKIPMNVGWYPVYQGTYRSRISIGPQLLVILSQEIANPEFETSGLGIQGDWTHYFYLNNDLDFIAVMHYEQTTEDMYAPSSYYDQLRNFGVHFGVNYHF